MEFFIKKNATLPILKLQVVKDGRSDYNSFMDMIENSAIFFSMTNVENGIPKISTNTAGFVEKVLMDPNADPEYYIYYQFKPQDTNKVARYEGQFLLRNSDGVLILPIREQLFINVQESFIAEDLPYDSCYVIDFPCCNNSCPTTTTTTTVCCCPQDSPVPTETPIPTPTNTPAPSPFNPDPAPIDEFCMGIFVPTPTPTPTNTQTPTPTPLACCSEWYYYGGWESTGSTFSYINCSGNTSTFDVDQFDVGTICAIFAEKISGTGSIYIIEECGCAPVTPSQTPTPTPTITPTVTPTDPPPTPTPTGVSTQCTNCESVSPLPCLGTSVTYAGVTITSSGTYGYCLDTPSDVQCGIQVPINSVIMGWQSGSFTFTFTFSSPVNNIEIILLSVNYLYPFGFGPDVITITTNVGNPVLTKCDGCCTEINGNVITASNSQLDCLNQGGPAMYGAVRVRISELSPYTTITISNPVNGTGGMSAAICEDSINPNITLTPTPTKTVTPSITPTKTPTPTPTPNGGGGPFTAFVSFNSYNC